MELTLNGRIITPIITKKTSFQLEGCRVEILHPKRRFITKSHKKQRIYPFSFIGYLGKLRLTYRCHTLAQAKAKLKDLLTIANIGRFWSEGLGQVEWLSGKFSGKTHSQKKRHYGRVKIRKGLPHKLPSNIQQLIRYAMLHDFVHTSKHKSKIYVELEVEDLDLLRQHHDFSKNKLVQMFQRYDRLASSMTRKVRSPRTNRYTWEAKGTIDFELLVQVLTSHEKNIWRLYTYIYESRELQQLSESLDYGHSSLRYHLLLIVNLIVQDFLKGTL
ncbi:MAG: hypothetical protein ACFE9L_11340 [Candidatus Hodarchaeota archaeon]